MYYLRFIICSYLQFYRSWTALKTTQVDVLIRCKFTPYRIFRSSSVPQTKYDLDFVDGWGCTVHNSFFFFFFFLTLFEKSKLGLVSVFFNGCHYFRSPLPLYSNRPSIVDVLYFKNFLRRFITVSGVFFCFGSPLPLFADRRWGSLRPHYLPSPGTNLEMCGENAVSKLYDVGS